MWILVQNDVRDVAPPGAIWQLEIKSVPKQRYNQGQGSLWWNYIVDDCNSIPTMTFAPENIRYIDHIYSGANGEEETCMTEMFLNRPPEDCMTEETLIRQIMQMCVDRIFLYDNELELKFNWSNAFLENGDAANNNYKSGYIAAIEIDKSFRFDVLVRDHWTLSSFFPSQGFLLGRQKIRGISEKLDLGQSRDEQEVRIFQRRSAFNLKDNAEGIIL
ncbi:hypothetical protein VTP01DRAFT_5374 [Rhizomucor pusillus]|uniref:uncharacterized protein n=1 Tax=Rhizomucor pusillus TaxID=4840 RepID=UPI0037447340